MYPQSRATYIRDASGKSGKWVNLSIILLALKAIFISKLLQLDAGGRGSGVRRTPYLADNDNSVDSDNAGDAVGNSNTSGTGLDYGRATLGKSSLIGLKRIR